MSALPLIAEAGRAVGMVHEYDLLNALVANRVKFNDSIDAIITPMQGAISLDTSINRLREIFAQDNVAVVKDGEKLVGILVQTDRFGTSVAEALRTQSDFLRVRRRQNAEERAGKVGVKLVFPIFFFTLPALMVVTAGPGLLQIFTKLLPAMRGISQ